MIVRDHEISTRERLMPAAFESEELDRDANQTSGDEPEGKPSILWTELACGPLTLRLVLFRSTRSRM